jgi:PAS domain S-box-containing protein
MAIRPAGGIGLAALLLNPRRLWPAILITLFIAGNSANLIEGRHILNSLGFMTANTLESLGSAWLITLLCGEKVRFNRIRDVFALALSATVVNAITAFIGAGTAALSNTDSLWNFYVTWWISDGLGILILTPLIVTWSDFKDFSLRKNWKWITETVIFLAIWCIVSWFIYDINKSNTLLNPQPYFLYILLIWAALRLGQKSMTLALAIGFIIAITSTGVITGPLLWGGHSYTERLILAQMFLAVGSFAGLMLAASFDEKSSAEKSAREEQTRMKALGDNIPNGMVYQVIIDKNGGRRFQYVSAGVERINGITAKEVMTDSMNLYKLTFQDDIDRLRTAEKIAISEMKQLNIIIRLVRPDGQLRWMEISSSPEKLPDGSVIWNGIQLDITERMKTEEALRENELIFSSFLEHSPVYVFFKDRNIRSLRLSKNYEQMLGMPIENTLGKNMDELFPSDLAKSMVEDDKKILEKGEVVKVVEELAGRTYETTKFPIFKDGKPNMLAGFTLDITARVKSEEERKKLEEQLQQAMKMEAIGRLAGGIAHDFNNLLTAIQGNVEIAMIDLKPDDPIVLHMGEVLKAVDSATSLTRQLLTFSRKQVIEPTIVNLNTIIEKLYNMLTRLIGENIEILTIPGEDLWAIKVDAGQFEQVIINLAVNSRDAMPDGGTLKIETSNTSLDEEYSKMHPQVHPGEYVLLRITDTGAGMSKEVQEHLFEPFFTTKPLGLGTGLGLATIFGIVRQAGGSIEIYSETGKGTSVSIYLPKLDETPSAPQSYSSDPDLPGGNETILLVEDDPSVLKMALSIIERLGYQVLSASNAEEAFILASSYHDSLNLLITDVVMPGMNGRELSEKLKSIHPEIKILFTSGYPENIIAHHGMLEKNINFIGKPYTMTAFAIKIRDVIEQET